MTKPPRLAKWLEVRSLAQLLFIAAMMLAGPACLCRLWNYPDNLAGDPKAGSFDIPKEIAALRSAPPQWILVGNSMLNSRVDPTLLKRISGVKVRKLAKGGTQSAVWFLIFKNIVLKSECRPQVVTFFFRDTDLTWPDFRIKGVNERFIADLDGPAQPEWAQVLGPRTENGSGLPAQLTITLKQIFPASDLRPIARRQLQERAFRLSPIGLKANSSVRRAELNERFSLSHLRHDLGLDFASSGGGSETIEVDGEIIDPGFYEDGPAKFDPSPDASFLPHLIALAKEQGILLHFHRIKRRPAHTNTRPDPPRLTNYLTELRRYLDSNGCVYSDESADPALTLAMYADGDHIASEPAVQAQYIANFWQRVAPLVKPRLAAPR